MTLTRTDVVDSGYKENRGRGIGGSKYRDNSCSEFCCEGEQRNRAVARGGTGVRSFFFFFLDEK